MDLRQYQLDCVSAVLEDWQTVTRTAIEVAVGGGKTVIAAEIIKRTLQANPNAKIVTLAHRRELLKSMQKTIAAHCGVTVGMVDGQVNPAMRKKNLEAQVVCINTATLGISKRARSNAGNRLAAVSQLHDVLGNVDLVILDECHRANTDTALDCLTELGCFSGVRLLGMTGTLFRTDTKMLTDVFENCCYRKGIMELIQEGFLSDVVMKQAHVDGMDLNKVGISRSMSIEDFNATDLDKVMEAAGAEAVIARYASLYTQGRKTLVFTPTVNAAERTAQAFRAEGLTATVVHGSMSPADRADALDRFENGDDLQYIINCMIITEGTDLPSCSAIIMARPTKSQQLYIQILGRALRLHDDKENALIIDLVGATAVNNLVSASTIFGAEVGETAGGAATRQATTAAFVQGVAAAVHAALDPEDQEEFDLESIVSGSFNLFDVEIEELVEMVKAKAKESRESKERERVKKLPSFPAPGRCGSLLELDFDFLVSLTSWATLPQYKNSYAAGICHQGKWYAFYCDSSKTFDNGRYGFICDGVSSFEEMEYGIIEFTKTFPATKDAMYYSQNKLQPNSPARKKQASAEQIKLMFNLMTRHKVRADEITAYRNKEMKQKISIGACVDWIDYLFLAPDARKQCANVKEFLNEKMLEVQGTQESG